MKQTILKSLMLSAVLLTGLQAFAHEFEVINSDGVTIYYNITSATDLTVEVTFKGSYSDNYYGYDEYSGHVTIPEKVTYSGIAYSVTSIGGGAFSYCSSLTSVTIPSSVTSIGDGAFFACSSLTSVTIPNSVTSIDYGTFSYCSSLTSVTIPNSVTSIDYGAFSYCSSLTSVTIPNSVTSIGEHTFFYCYGLESVTIPNSVTSIGDCVFSGCRGLTSIVVESGNTVYDSRNNCNAIIETATNTLIQGCNNSIIPNSVTSIDMFAFSYCSSLTSITIPSSVTSIGLGAFFECSGLESVMIPNSVTSIGYYVFSGCRGLTSIVVESGNTVYDSRNNCNAIIETATNTLIQGCNNSIITNSVTSIDMYAFSYCSSLTSVTIPSSVTSIGDFAFSDCSSLSEIICENVTPAVAYDNTFISVPTAATLYVPVGSKDAYASATGWSYFTNIVEDDGNTGVKSTLADDTGNPSEYYNLQGVKVEKPDKGIYVKKQGSKTTKVVL